MGFFSRVNVDAQKKRHCKIEEVGKRGKVNEFIKNKRGEKEFFWRVLSVGTFIFFFSSILPNFVSTEVDFWIPADASTFIDSEKFALADEGFLIKPDVQTERGDRQNITDIVYITVQAGDTISSIANKYGISSYTIIENNDIANANQLKVGQTLTILPVNGLLYTVKKGDTIEKIAKKNNLTNEKLASQNELTVDSELKIDQKLIIPGARAPKPVMAIGGSSGGNVFSQTPGDIGSGTEYNGTLFFPCQGKYTQYYHYGHYAVDIAQSGGSPVWSAEGGEVIKAQGGWNGGYGNVVIIDHGNGMKTLYAHLREIYVNVGQQVGRGQAIGYMGNTGRVYGRTGIHLHFEVMVNDVKKNPVAYF